MAGLAPVPFAGMVLSDFGADVVRVDRNGPVAIPDMLARGKRSVAVDVKNPLGVEAVAKLASAADILIEPYRPGVMEKLGLGPEVLCKRNPRLIYARLTGFGQTGPLAKAAGHDINYVAMSGLLSTISRRADKPLPPLNLLADFAGGGLMCAMGVLVALLERNASGKGQVIDCSMLDSIVYLGALVFKLRAAGAWSDTVGTNMLDSGAHFYESYATKDGKFMAVGSIEPQFYSALLKGLQLDPASLPHQMDESSWPKMKALFSEIFARRTRDEWVSAFAGLDACVTPVLTIPDLSSDAHAAARKLFIPDNDGGAEAAPAPKLSRTPGRSSAPPCPDIGVHTKEVFTSPEWGNMSTAEFDALAASGVVASNPSPRSSL